MGAGGSRSLAAAGRDSLNARVVGLASLCFECAWLREAVDRTVILIATRLSDDVHDTADRLTVLRFEPARLHLDFFDERRVDARSERAVRPRERADTAERRVGDVHTVCDVEVVECGTAGYRRIITTTVDT